MALRRYLVVVTVIAGVGGGAGAGRADHAPAIAIPGKRGVPVIIDWQNATGAIVIGDWGLYRPGQVAPTIIYRQPWPLPRYRAPAAAVRSCRCRRARPVRRKVVKGARRRVIKSGRWHYYPSGTVPPKIGRYEHDVPARRPPVPAQPFSRSWSARSAPLPATTGPPTLLVEPTISGNRFRPRPRRPRPRR